MPKTQQARRDDFLPRSAARAVRGGLAPEENPAILAIWDVLGAIPRGTASTYGALARAAGFPGRARLAGRALKLLPKEMVLPWYRVVGAGGRIAFPKGTSRHREQARLLRAEGVSVIHGRVRMEFMIDLENL